MSWLRVACMCVRQSVSVALCVWLASQLRKRSRVAIAVRLGATARVGAPRSGPQRYVSVRDCTMGTGTGTG